MRNSYKNGFSLLQHRLPLSESLSDGETSDHAVDLCPPLAHVVLDVKHKRMLAKVSVYNLSRSLQPYCGTQVGLGKRRKKKIKKETDRK